MSAMDGDRESGFGIRKSGIGNWKMSVGSQKLLDDGSPLAWRALETDLIMRDEMWENPRV